MLFAVESFPLLERTLPVFLLVFFWLWETWIPFFGWREGRIRHALRNLGISLFNTTLLALFLGGATVAVAEWAAAQKFGLLSLVPLPEWGRFMIAFLLLDAWTYLWHAANHHVPFLWLFHRMHHSDPKMDVTTATRFHLGELVISKGMRLALIPLLGVPVGPILVYDLILVSLTQFHHADISIGGLDRWIRWLIVTPDMHKVHHSRRAPETNSNFSSVFSIWDRLGRTFRHRADVHAIEFGLPNFDEPIWQTFWGMCKTPCVRSTPIPGTDPLAGEPSTTGPECPPS